MTVMRPPVTGDAQLDSWMNQVTKEVGSAATVATASAAKVSGVTNGINTATLVLYKRYSSDILPYSENIAVDSSYNYESTVLTNASTGSTTDFSGWSPTHPHVNNGIFLFSIQVNIADTGAVAIIPADDWSSPSLILAEGMNSATVTLYQRTASAVPPANPIGDLIFNFGTGTYTRTDSDSWTTFGNIDPEAGDYLWVAMANIQSRDYTATFPSSAWQVNLGAANGQPGESITGPSGGQYGSYRLWWNAAVGPTSAPVAYITWATGVVTIETSGWSLLAPTLDPTGTTVAYFSDLAFTDPSGEAVTTYGIATNPQRTINFDGIVTFTNLNTRLADATTVIDGDRITTGQVSTSVLNVDEILSAGTITIGTGTYEYNPTTNTYDITSGIPEGSSAAGVFFYPSADWALPTTTEFNTRFGRDPINNDVIEVKNLTAGINYGIIKRYIWRSLTSQWDFITVAIDGNLLVDGTVYADAISADFISTLGIIVGDTLPNGTFHYFGDGTSAQPPSDADFYALYGRYPKYKDVLFSRYSNQSFRNWINNGSYPSGWVEFGVRINGNLIVDGTVYADALNIDGITLDSDGAGNLIVKSGGIRTGELALGAVTNVSSAYTNASIATTLGTYTVQSLAVTTQGGPVNINASCITFLESDIAEGQASSIQIQLYRDTTLLAYSTMTTPATGGGYIGGEDTVAYSFKDSVAAGSYTYYLKAVATGNGGSVKGRSLLLTELKR